MSNTTRRAAFFSASLACVAGSAVCLGQPGVYEPFAYPPGAEVVGQSGGTGFSGPWQSAGYGGWQTGTSGLGRLKVWQLMQGQSGAQSMRSSSGGVQRSLAAPIAGTEGTEVWISFLAKHTGPTEGSWLGVKLPCSGAGADPPRRRQGTLSPRGPGPDGRRVTVRGPVQDGRVLFAARPPTAPPPSTSWNRPARALRSAGQLQTLPQIGAPARPDPQGGSTLACGLTKS